MLSALQRQLPTMHIDESVKVDHVLRARCLDGRDFNVNFVLGIVDNIFILNKIAFKCLSNEGPHSTTIYLLRMLSTYPWEAKLTMMLATLAINYGEFNVVFLLHNRKGLTLLKQSLNIVPSFDNRELVDNSIKFILDLTKCIVDHKQPSYYSTLQSLNSTLPTESYWITRNVLTNATHFAHLLMMGIKSQNELTELSNLTAKVKDIITACNPLLEKKKSEESYETFSHVSNNYSDESFRVNTEDNIMRSQFMIDNFLMPIFWDGKNFK